LGDRIPFAEQSSPATAAGAILATQPSTFVLLRRENFFPLQGYTPFAPRRAEDHSVE